MNARIVVMLLSVASWLPAQQIDLSSLDKLAGRASSTNTISMNREQIAAALNLLLANKNSAQEEQLKRLVASLSGLEVRSFEFDTEGQYRDADLAAVRAQVTKGKSWTKVIDSKEDGEHSEIYVNSVEGQKGLMVISAEETEVSIILLKGVSSLSSLGSLGAITGLPSMSLSPGKKSDH